MDEIHSLITSFKDLMPHKSMRVDELHIIWIQATQHDNYKDDDVRAKFNNCLKVIGKDSEQHGSLFSPTTLGEEKSQFCSPP